MKDFRKAFTLVELLVVISIIALLLAVLMPSLGRARKQAQKVICMTHMKQVTLGIMVYSVDNKNYVPNGFRGEGYPLTDYALWDINNGWVGIGKLYEYKYLPDHKVFYCPTTQSTMRKGLPFSMEYEWNDKNGGSLICGTLYHRGAFDWKLDSPEKAKYTHINNPNASYAFIPGKRPYAMLSCLTYDLAPFKLGHLVLKGRPITMSDGSVKWVTFEDVPNDRSYPRWKDFDRQ